MSSKEKVRETGITIWVRPIMGISWQRNKDPGQNSLPKLPSSESHVWRAQRLSASLTKVGNTRGGSGLGGEILRPLWSPPSLVGQWGAHIDASSSCMGMGTWEGWIEEQTRVWKQGMMETVVRGGNGQESQMTSRRRRTKGHRKGGCQRSHMMGGCKGGRNAQPGGPVRGQEGRGMERPLHLVTRAYWQPARTQVNPEWHSLVGGEARWRFKIYGRESAKRINCPVGTVS